MKRIKNSLVVCFAAIIGITGIILVSSNISFAASQGSSSDDGGGGRPGCYKYNRVNKTIIKNGQTIANPSYISSPKSYYDDTCFGGVWWEYPVNGNNNIQVSSYGSVKGGSLKGCVDDGAEKYYRLSLVKYDTHDNYSNPSNIDTSKYTMRWSGGTPEQVGLWPVNLFAGAGGYTTYRDSEGLNWAEIKRKFQVAVEHGAGMDGNKWEDISMFCYSESWEGTKSSFNSWSWVNETSTGDIGPDSKVTEEMETTEDSVTVSFKHQLSYNKPDAAADSRFDPAKTDWWVEVTEDGRVVKTFPRTTFVLQNSGPQRNSVWDDMDFLGVTENYEVQLPEGTESKTVCSKITYTPKYISWDEDQNQAKHFVMNSQDSNGQEDSEACIVIKKKVPTTVTGDFTSSSTVIIDPADNPNTDIRTYHSLTTDPKKSGDQVEIIISTDEPTTNVKFYHQIYWNGSTYPKSTDAANKIAFDDVSNTDYEILDESGAATGDSGNHKTSTDNANSGKKYVEEIVPVDLKKGETKKVCRKITYDPQSYTYETYKKNHGTTKNPDWWTHYKESSTGGEGDSEACATITRPADPDKPGDDPGVTGPTTGGNDSTPMYAGEDVTPSWQGKTKAYNVRRLMEWQAIIFQVPVSTNLGNGSLTLGNIETGDGSDGAGTRRTHWEDPCTWYNTVKNTNWPYRNALAGGSACQIVKSSNSNGISSGSNGQHSYQWPGGDTASAGYQEELTVGNFSERLVVPNQVGDKYCNSLGFQFQYYYGYRRSAGASIEWHEDTANPRYWTVYDAACRAIAKKPSVAMWNGGLFVGNGSSISTSVANRYRDTALNTLTSAGGEYRSFGSWSEYLATVAGSVTNFASGAALSFHGGSAEFNLVNNSPLTIANTDPNNIGSSGITTNSLLTDRLQDYIFTKYNIPDPNNTSINKINRTGNQTSFSIGLGEGMRGTTIVSIDGRFTIDHNITTQIDSTNNLSIHTLPQVVIYASEGIDIDSRVTQIDAWLVTDKDLNTCSNGGSTQFSQGHTEAKVAEYRNNPYCSESLQINGPVFAKSVTLNRTYGADGISQPDRDLAESNDWRAATGEVFNLSADSYLWAWVQSGRYNSSYSEAYSRELPPRY